MYAPEHNTIRTYAVHLHQIAAHHPPSLPTHTHTNTHIYVMLDFNSLMYDVLTSMSSRRHAAYETDEKYSCKMWRLDCDFQLKNIVAVSVVVAVAYSCHKTLHCH